MPNLARNIAEGVHGVNSAPKWEDGTADNKIYPHVILFNAELPNLEQLDVTEMTSFYGGR